MPPPGVRFVRDNGNGTSQWQGPGGAVVDVHHERPDMADFAPPQQQLADNAPVPQAAPVGTQAPAAAPVRASDFFNVNVNQLAEAAHANAPRPASQPSNDQAQRDAAYYAQFPDQQPAGNRILQQITAANRPAVAPIATPVFAPPTAQGRAGSSGAVAAPVVQGRGTPRTSAMVPHATSQTVQSGADIPDDLINGIRQGSDFSAAAALHTGLNEQAELGQNAQTLADRNRIIGGLGGLMDQSVANEQGRGDRLEQARLNFEDIANRARSMTVDPDRRSGGDRITGAIASLLGGIGSGITGGPNHAVQIIQHAIDRDVEAQRSNVANAQHGTATAQTAYQLARDQGASERDAENVHMGFEYRRAADEVERLAALTGSQEAMDEATITAEGLRATGAALEANVRNLGSDRTSTTTQSRLVTSGGTPPVNIMVQQVDEHGNYIPGSELIPLGRLPAAAQTAVLRNQAPNLRIVSGVGGGNSSAPLSSSDSTASRDYGPRMQALGRARAALQRIEAAVRAHPTQTSNAGRILPNELASNQVELAHSAVDEFYNEANRAMNGTRATDRDRENVVAGSGPLIDRGNELVLENIARQNQALDEAEERIRAMVNDAVVDHNESRIRGNEPAAPMPSSVRRH